MLKKSACSIRDTREAYLVKRRSRNVEWKISDDLMIC
jgi:hypothetical protein